MTIRSWSRPLRICLLGALGLTLQGGCETHPLDEAAPMRMTQEGGIKIANACPAEVVVFNGISTNAQANFLMRTSALGSLFNNATTEEGNFIRDQLTDPNARHFMKYLAGCALSAAQTLPWQSSGGHSGAWMGGAGLCTQWLDSAPSDDCLERVSACILARISGVNRRVELSCRGMDSNGTAFSLEAQPSSVEYDPEVPATDKPIESFLACASSTTDSSRNCGWSKDFIGSCTPGAWVQLGAGSQAKDAAGVCSGHVLGNSTAPETILRVCEGIVGCNRQGERFLTESTGGCSPTQKPSASFTCPPSGFFNVMKAPRSSWQALGSVNVEVLATEENEAAYRLSEAQAFPFREGAFYGNLFSKKKLAAEVTVTPNRTGVGDGTRTISPSLVVGSVYPDMYVCHDPEWEQGAAYATHRVCALPGLNANCAATAVGPCNGGAASCATSDAGPVLGDGDYDGCQDLSGVTWNDPVTVFLNGPCDLMPAGQPLLCKRIP